MERALNRDAGTSTTAIEAPWTALVVDDDAGVRQSLRLCLEAAGARVLGVATSGGAIEALDRRRFDVVFLDLWLGAEKGLDLLPELLVRQPDLGVIVVTAYASIESAVNAVKRGAVDYVPKPFTPDQIRLAASRVVQSQQLRRRLQELQEELDESGEPAFFESRSPVFFAFLQSAARAAASDAVLLLRGESGTGKNFLARWIRANSPRAHAPFVVATSPSAWEDRIQGAEGGTLLLDEVGDLTTDAQTRLLRFLNDRTYGQRGDAHGRQADVRVLAASNRDIERQVQVGRFRQDLFHRLNVVTLPLPALRERPEDILPLAHHYLSIFGEKQRRSGLSFSPDAEQALLAHAWPGNLRELRNAVERAVILARRSVIDAGQLGLLEALTSAVDGTTAFARVGAMIPLDSVEREHIARVVAQSTSLEAAARVLGIDATTLQRKRKRYGLM
jgi:two-component system, NtrC family, response regulator AlgB